MEVQNSYPKLSYRHLSHDDYEILNACVWSLSLVVVLIIISCKSLELHSRNSTLHWLNILLFSSEVLTLIVYGLTITELNQFGISGTSLQSSRIVIAAFQICQQTCIVLTTLLYTKGWLYGREKISVRGRVFIAIASSLYIGCTFFLLMFSAAGLVVVPKQLPMRVAPYAGSTGILIVLLRCIIAAWVMFVICTTLKRDHQSTVWRVGVIGVLWLILPCVINAMIFDQAPCSDRPTVIITEAVCTLVLLLGLEFALWPYNHSIHLLRGRTSVQKANEKLSECFRTGGTSACWYFCCPNTLTWEVSKKSLPEQCQIIKNDITFMDQKLMTLTQILKDMLDKESVNTNISSGSIFPPGPTGPTGRGSMSGSNKEFSRKQFGGGIGTMEEVQNSTISSTLTTKSPLTTTLGDVQKNKHPREFVLPPIVKR
jgi:hypothetical protein